MNRNLYPTDTSYGNRLSIQTPEFGNYSSSTASFSSNGSSISQQDSHSFYRDAYHSPDYTYTSDVSMAGFTDNADDLEYRLRQLESAMLGTDQEFIETNDVSSSWASTNQFALESTDDRTMTDMISRRDFKELLIACAKAVAENDAITANWLISELRSMVSVFGEPVHRLGAYMLEGLVARLSSSGSSIYKSLKCKEPSGGELFSYMRLLYEACPYFKFGYLSANGAIAEAMKNENKIHIIDFQIAQGSQWVTLIQALASRPGGPPRLKITGVDDSTNAYARGGGVNIVGQRLASLAESCNIPFEFHGVSVSGSEIEVDHLGVQPGEPIAVNFAFMLHHMPDESVDPQNHRDRLLRLVKSLSPKVVTLVEQESNVNTAPFFNRFQETFSYYLAIFESIDATLPKDHHQRINVEQHCLARDIVNIIACEGAERVERHELLGKWKSRFTMAGFTPYPLSSLVNSTIKALLLENYSQKYRLEERDGALFLGWMNRNLVASCAWK
uniref:scarecrow-like protein 21 n=1 Tax=Erigeron canadensis TaxID=72917 RepID=UPI001CB8A6FD|nr:scarecrow-like protein 21 [Erigeron canadensis]XP_043608857.1 scarecrow-like protein 21 [Erigeron canadensis]XP_043608860.1 scarecrow-like protein 21 [Erigeron canadensis]